LNQKQITLFSSFQTGFLCVDCKREEKMPQPMKMPQQALAVPGFHHNVPVIVTYPRMKLTWIESDNTKHDIDIDEFTKMFFYEANALKYSNVKQTVKRRMGWSRNKMKNTNTTNPKQLYQSIVQEWVRNIILSIQTFMAKHDEDDEESEDEHEEEENEWEEEKNPLHNFSDEEEEQEEEVETEEEQEEEEEKEENTGETEGKEEQQQEESAEEEANKEQQEEQDQSTFYQFLLLWEKLVQICDEDSFAVGLFSLEFQYKQKWIRIDQLSEFESMIDQIIRLDSNDFGAKSEICLRVTYPIDNTLALNVKSVYWMLSSFYSKQKEWVSQENSVFTRFFSEKEEEEEETDEEEEEEEELEETTLLEKNEQKLMDQNRSSSSGHGSSVYGETGIYVPKHRRDASTGAEFK